MRKKIITLMTALLPLMAMAQSKNVSVDSVGTLGNQLTDSIRFKVTDDYSILAMIRQDMGYSLMYRLTLAGFSEGVKVIPLRDPITRTIALGWRNFQTLPYAARAFIGHIRREAPGILAHLET